MPSFVRSFAFETNSCLVALDLHMQVSADQHTVAIRSHPKIFLSIAKVVLKLIFCRYIFQEKNFTFRCRMHLGPINTRQPIRRMKKAQSIANSNVLICTWLSWLAHLTNGKSSWTQISFHSNGQTYHSHTHKHTHENEKRKTKTKKNQKSRNALNLIVHFSIQMIIDHVLFAY